MQAVGELVRPADLVGVRGVDEDRRVDVPVAEMAVEDHGDVQLGAHLTRAPDRARDLRERHGEVLAREDAVFVRMREGGGRGETAAGRPQPRDLRLRLRELRHGRAATHDAVDVAHR